MNYKNISETLKERGYATQFHNILNSLAVCIPEDGKFKLDSFFRIELKKEKINLSYFIGQIPIEKEFGTIEELLDFIKEVFPIES